MKSTMLDMFIGSCLAHKNRLHVFDGMDKVLHQAPPMAHIWETKDPLQVPLAAGPLKLPDTSMCLQVVPGLTPGYYRFCLDQDIEAPILEDFLGKHPWSLEAVLIYQFDEDSFDAIPLARQMAGGDMVMPEMQLHFELEPDGWIWKKSDTGCVNAFFHNVMLRMIEDQSEVENSIRLLGSIVNYTLGSYVAHINQPGEWQIHLPREAKLKLKNGKVKKVYQDASVGYRQFLPFA